MAISYTYFLTTVIRIRYSAVMFMFVCPSAGARNNGYLASNQYTTAAGTVRGSIS